MIFVFRRKTPFFSEFSIGCVNPLDILDVLFVMCLLKIQFRSFYLEGYLLPRVYTRLLNFF